LLLRQPSRMIDGFCRRSAAPNICASIYPRLAEPRLGLSSAAAPQLVRVEQLPSVRDFLHCSTD
jgi:hypothetical protein